MNQIKLGTFLWDTVYFILNSKLKVHELLKDKEKFIVNNSNEHTSNMAYISSNNYDSKETQKSPLKVDSISIFKSFFIR